MINIGDLDQKQRVIIFGGILFLATALILFLFLSNTESERSGSAQRPIGGSEKAEIETVITNFLETTGAFGVDPSQIEDDNAAALEKIEIEMTENQASLGSLSYFRTREQAQQESNEFLSDLSPYHSKDSTNSNDLTNALVGFTIEVKSVEVASEKTVEGEEEWTTATVSFDSTMVTRTPTGRDLEWDGSYIVERKLFSETATVEMKKEDGDWGIYLLSDLKSRSLLASVWQDMFQLKESVEPFYSETVSP